MCADISDDLQEQFDDLSELIETALSEQIEAAVELGDCYARCSDRGVVVAAEVQLPEVEEALNNAFSGDVEVSPIEVELGDAP